MIEVILKCDKRVVIESLSRIGIANKDKKIIFPSCYFYEKDGKTYIAHFKELFQLTKRDNAYLNMCEDDILRLKSITWNLKNWQLLDVVNESDVEPHFKYVFVLPYKEKVNWTISHKFNIRNLYLKK